eukprot:1604986-Rhodomonas_salina.1
MVKQLKDQAEFDAAVAEAGEKTMFIDFTATWCGPCKRIGPVFEELAEKNDGAVFYKVDVDENEAVSQKFGITAMPTFHALKKGVKVAECVGADPGKLEAMINENK